MPTMQPLTIAAFAAAGFAAWGAWNLSGACYSTGRFLSEDDKIEVVAQSFSEAVRPDANQLQAWISTMGIDRPPNGVKAVIPYESGHEFLEKNPDCCVLRAVYGEHIEPMPQPRFWDRWVGRAWGIATVTWKQYFLDPAGSVQSFTFTSQGWMTSCGEYKPFQP
ncbi:MAG: hypothetical protein KF914_08750 [Rhizobiaceae bacterium]|nr:hypothetical protein [Rhizobiaceae bacterium]